MYVMIDTDHYVPCHVAYDPAQQEWRARWKRDDLGLSRRVEARGPALESALSALAVAVRAELGMP